MRRTRSALSTSRTGETCTTVGQIVAGKFGVVGLDGRFRELAEGAVDGCGGASTTLIGARVFEARRPADVRTVVNGVAGKGLRGVTIITATGNTTAKPGRGGSFLAVVSGYPDQTALEVSLRFAGGRVERHSLGSNPNLFVGAGEAWETFPFVEEGSPKHCLSFEGIRQPIAQGPSECATPAELRKPDGYSLAIRRIDSSYRGWGKHPPVTGVWGQAGAGAVRVEVITPKGTVKGHFVPPKRNFVFVFPPSVDPKTISVRITFRDGRVVTAAHDSNTVTPPKGGA